MERVAIRPWWGGGGGGGGEGAGGGYAPFCAEREAKNTLILK